MRQTYESYMDGVRRREFCGGCEAGVPHNCKRFDDSDD